MQEDTSLTTLDIDAMARQTTPFPEFLLAATQEEPLQAAARKLAEATTPKPRYGEIEVNAARIAADAKALARHLSDATPAMSADLFDIMPKPKGQSSKIKLGGSFRNQNPEAWLKAKKRKRKLTKLNKKNGRR